MTAVLRRLSPWSPAESRRLLLLVGAGLVVVAVAWWIVSREAAWSEQTDAMGLAVIGAMVAAYGVTSWLLRARAVCTARRNAMFAVLGDVGPGRTAAPIVVIDEGPAEFVVAHPEQGRYHRPDCALAAGTNWPTVPRVELADRQACGVCTP
ncbi:hypothetical protein GCM10009547_19910 [Sporichthya brevicatena]|uniref:Uncharacterized protein n=1 Tax=Sporichthya brevicatena TaxID=171442 RepID=A0ABP3RU94_9ACTN